MNLILRWVLNAAALGLVAWLLKGIHSAGTPSLLITALVLGILNIFLRPLLTLATLPVNILTLGLFTFIINGLMLFLAAQVVPGFTIDGFWWAVLGALLYSVISYILNTALQPE